MNQITPILPIAITGERVPGPGVYRMLAETYHADPAPEPSLSSSIAVEVVTRTPRHAWTAHPRLNKAPVVLSEERAPTRPMEIGSVAHKLLLDEGDEIVVVEADDYRTAIAKAERANAYADGKQPILSVDYKRASLMADAAIEQLLAAGVMNEFAAGLSEVVLVWQDVGGIYCRAMMDKLWVDGNRAIIFDIKTTSAETTQDDLGRRIVDMGYEMRAAFYERGLISMFPRLAGRIEYIHLWLEVDPPFALLPARLDATGLWVGRKKAAAAIGIWSACMAAGSFPLYPPGVATVEYPIWAEKRWIDREVSDEVVAAVISRDPLLNGAALNEPERAPRRMVPGV